jgi:hypothetical protein
MWNRPDVNGRSRRPFSGFYAVFSPYLDETSVLCQRGNPTAPGNPGNPTGNPGNHVSRSQRGARPAVRLL